MWDDGTAVLTGEAGLGWRGDGVERAVCKGAAGTLLYE